MTPPYLAITLASLRLLQGLGAKRSIGETSALYRGVLFTNWKASGMALVLWLSLLESAVDTPLLAFHCAVEIVSFCEAWGMLSLKLHALRAPPRHGLMLLFRIRFVGCSLSTLFGLSEPLSEPGARSR